MAKLKLKDPKKDQKKVILDTSMNWRTMIPFNFSYLISDKKYNHTQMEYKVHKKLLERICTLSTHDFVTVKSWKKEEGFEKLKIKKLNPPTPFITSGRDEKAGPEFWVFRLNKLGRVVCKRIETTFYIIAIDTTFDLYDH